MGKPLHKWYMQVPKTRRRRGKRQGVNVMVVFIATGEHGRRRLTSGDLHSRAVEPVTRFEGTSVLP